MTEKKNKKSEDAIFDTVIVDTSDDLFNFCMNEDENKKKSGMYNGEKLKEIQNRYNNKTKNDAEENNEIINEKKDNVEIIEFNDSSVKEKNVQNKNDNEVEVTFDELIRVYINNNYNKIVTSKFSFPGFFFNIFYFLYRKMYFEYIIATLLIFALSVASGFILNTNIILGIIIIVLIFILSPILCGICMNKLYLKKVYMNVRKIMDTESNNINLVAKCARKGGVSVLSIIVIPMLQSFLIGVVLVIFIAFGSYKQINKLKDKYQIQEANDSKVQVTTNNTSNQGLIYYYDSDSVNDVLDISVPSNFEESIFNDEDGNPIVYEINTNNSTSIFNACELKVSIYKNFSTPEELLKAKLNGKESNTKIKNIKINNNEWYFFELDETTVFSSLEQFNINYATFTKNKKILYLNYVIEKNADKEECLEYFNKIKNSLKVK